MRSPGTTVPFAIAAGQTMEAPPTDVRSPAEAFAEAGPLANGTTSTQKNTRATRIPHHSQPPPCVRQHQNSRLNQSLAGSVAGPIIGDEEKHSSQPDPRAQLVHRAVAVLVSCALASLACLAANALAVGSACDLSCPWLHPLRQGGSGAQMPLLRRTLGVASMDSHDFAPLLARKGNAGDFEIVVGVFLMDEEHAHLRKFRRPEVADREHETRLRRRSSS